MATPATSPELHLHHLRPLKLLGTGATGTVFLVHNHLTDPSAHHQFALKVVDKRSDNRTTAAARRARWEVAVLRRLTHTPHPFLPAVIGSFEDDEVVAWGVPFCSGGDLNVLRQRQTDGVFSPAIIRFYVAEIVLALKHLHDLGIVYRDLKPENVLIQNSGHVTLTDFDLSKTLAGKTVKTMIQSPETTKHHRKKVKTSRVSPITRRNTSISSGERSNSFVGTEEYVSPEMVIGDGHDFAVDWWALGVLSYEMLYGTTPFRGNHRKDTFNRILTMPVKFTGKPSPLTDFITKLLEKDPSRRLGFAGGATEVQRHPFFDGLRWDMLAEVVRPPVIPPWDGGGSPEKVEGCTVVECLQKLRRPAVESPVGGECGGNVSFTEF